MHNVVLLSLGKLLILVAAVLADVVFLGLEADWLFLAVAGSFSGALVLAYSEHWKGFFNLAINTTLATICGLFCGSFAAKYFEISHPANVGFCFFLSGSLSLVGVVALISLWRGNAKDVLNTVLRARLGIPPADRDADETKNKRRK